MTWRRAILAASVLSTAALACEVILGIKNDDFRIADAATIADPCIHSLPPPPPDAGDVGRPLPSLVFAFEHSRIGGLDDAGRPVGFDLDGVCTCDTRPGSAHGGAPSCTPRYPDASVCDGEGGIDNAGAVNFPPLLATQIDKVFQQQASCGRSTVLLQLSEYNGGLDDPEVVVAIAASYGIFDPHDGGELIDAGVDCNLPTLDSGGFPAKFDGTDVWTVAPGEVDQGILRDRFHGYVTNGTLVVKLTAEATSDGWTFIFGGRVVPVRTALLTAKLTRQEPDGSFRLDDGLMVSRLAADDLLSTVGAARVNGDQYVCGSPELYSQLKSIICHAPDLTKLPGADFTNATCDAFAVAFQFGAGPAAIGKNEPPQVATPPGCGIGFVDTCANAP